MRLPGNIQLTVSPFFWLVAGVLGFLITKNFFMTILLAGIIFISVLFHEYGHAITSLFFGQKPRIALVPFGGITYPEGPRIRPWKEFIVVFNGPLFGFILAFTAFFLLQIPTIKQSVLAPILFYTSRINWIWSILNLLPVMPMDGGQLLRIIFEASFGAKGVKYSLMVSMILSGIGSLFFFLIQAFLAGALFFLFAYQNFETWRRMRNISDTDRNEHLKQQLAEVESRLKTGNIEESIDQLEKIRQQAKKGIIFQMATDTLGKIYFEMGKMEKCYQLLQSIYDDLELDSKWVLHEAAFTVKDWQTVKKLAAECFQSEPSKELALRTSMACAQLGDEQSSAGWFEAALENGLEDFEEKLQNPLFDPVRDLELFQKIKSKFQD